MSKKLEDRIIELEERTALMRGMILGTHDRITAMEVCFADCIAELREMATSLPGKKTPKASQGGSSVRSNTPCKKRQSTPHAGSSRSSRKKG